MCSGMGPSAKSGRGVEREARLRYEKLAKEGYRRIIGLVLVVHCDERDKAIVTALS